MENVKETLLELPWNVVDDCNGFGLDFGGSVCKVFYLHNDDWVEPGKRTTDKVALRCVSISRTEFHEGLAYLKPRVCIRRNDPDHKPRVFTSGVGGAQFVKEIEETFGVKTTTITELECFFAAFNFILRHNKRGEIVHENNKDLIDKQNKMMREQSRVMADMFKDSKNMEPMNLDRSGMQYPMEQPFDPDEMYLENYKDLFPCFLVMVGSNGGIFVIKEDGKYRFASDMKRAGRQFLGLASVLSKSKSYAEIMAKAEKGNMRNVHEYISDLTGTIDKSGDNFYSGIKKHEESSNSMKELPAFHFGKAVFKGLDDFSSEDMARSFVYATVDDIVHTVHTHARLSKIKHVFWCGGFPNHPLTRDFITEAWLERDEMGMTLFEVNELASLHFLKHGSHLGALGAFLNQHLKFIDIPTEAKTKDGQ